MEEAGVASLVISLVVNIRTLICPLLSHPGQLVVPDLVDMEVNIVVGTLQITNLPLGPYTRPSAAHRHHELSYFSPTVRQIYRVIYTNFTEYQKITSFLNIRPKSLDIFYGNFL